MRKLVTAALLTGVALTIAPAAFAQDSAGDSISGDDIVVTARRREENIATVPASITAFNAEALVERSIKSDSDLQLVTPGLTIRQTQGNNSLTYSIRGQTADTFSGSPSAVIAYLNEVPLTISSASTFYDLENIQVLKGPQGTLFGRNATGGAVLYNTAKPTDELAGLIRGRLGNFDLYEVEGMLNVPVDEAVLLRAAFNTTRRDGYIHNLFDDTHLGKIKRDSGRLTLTVKPSETIANTTMLQYTKTGGTNTGASYTYSVYGCGDTNNGYALTCGSGLLFGPGLDVAFGAPGLWAAYLAAHPKAYAPGLIAYVDEQKRMGARKTRHPGAAGHSARDWMLSNTTIMDFGDNLQLKNIIAYSDSATDSEQPQLGAPFVTILTANAAANQSGNELSVESFTEELQLQGDALDGKLNFIAGFYMQRQKSDTLWPQTYFDLRPILAPAYVTNNFRIKNNTEAVYGQASYALMDNLKFTAGLRYTWESVSMSQLPLATYTASAPDQHKNFSDPSWDVGLEFQATPELFAYLKTRGSFRSGGFNGAAPPISQPASGGGNLFDSEHTQDIEGGLKYNGTALGRPAYFNVAVFSQWIQDVQRVEFPDPDGPGGLASIAVTANVPSSKIWGIEAEASIRPADWLQIGAQGAYTNAKFTDGDIVLFGNPYSYGPVGDTPKTSGVFWVQLDFPAGENAGDISLRGEVYGQSSQYFSNAADTIAPGTKLPGYALLNGRLGWNNVMGSGFTAALFGKNLTDKTYFTGGMTLAAALGHNAAAVGEPRNYGLEISYSF